MSLLLSYKFGWNTTSSQMSQSSAPPAKNRRLSRRAQANELLVSAQAALEQGDYAALRSHLEALGAYADALKDDGAALYETLRSYID